MCLWDTCFPRFGLTWFWLTYPVTELLTTLLGVCFNYPGFSGTSLCQERAAAGSGASGSCDPAVEAGRDHYHRAGTWVLPASRLENWWQERLGIPFYYKEMTALAAQESGLDREFVSNLNKNAPRILYNLYLSTKVVRLAVTAQHKIIEKIAGNGSCVIVGRAADHVLKNHENVIRIFIYAPKAYRISR